MLAAMAVLSCMGPAVGALSSVVSVMAPLMNMARKKVKTIRKMVTEPVFMTVWRVNVMMRKRV